MKSTAKYECKRCNGSGATCFEHIERGICFACRGTGKVDFERTPRQLAPIVVSQDDIRTALREMFAVIRGYAPADHELQLTFKMYGTSRADMIAHNLEQAQGELRARSEAAFRNLLGANWRHVAASMQA